MLRKVLALGVSGLVLSAAVAAAAPGTTQSPAAGTTESSSSGTTLSSSQVAAPATPVLQISGTSGSHQS